MTNAQAFQEWFGIQCAPARFLAVLYAANGEAVSHENIRSTLGVSLSSIRASTVRIREAMDEGSYLALYGHGYRLTPAGLRECDRAIEDAGQRRRAA